MKKILLVGAAALIFAACSNDEKTITVNNPTDRQRHEVVAIDAATAAQFGPDFVLTNAKGEPVVFQKTHDGELLFMADVDAKSSAEFKVKKGKPGEFSPVATGRQYPERVDDIAWENDRIAFRAYGPALQASGERAFGYDIWVKSKPEPVVEHRYKMELDPKTLAAIDSLQKANPDSAAALRNATSYHVDHGNGMDCYKVGPTLGGGAAALFVGDSIMYPYCYKDCKILDRGPLRFRAELTYNPVNVNGREVTEHRTITLDAGSQLNRTDIVYEGLEEDATVVAGQVVHDPDGGKHAENAAKGYIAYADPTDNPNNNNGTIFVGSVFPEPLQDARLVMFDRPEAQSRGADGHVLGFAPYRKDSKFTYYWGGGWSKYGFDDFNQWEQYLDGFSENLRAPLEVTVK